MPAYDIEDRNHGLFPTSRMMSLTMQLRRDIKPPVGSFPPRLQHCGLYCFTDLIVLFFYTFFYNTFLLPLRKWHIYKRGNFHQGKEIGVHVFQFCSGSYCKPDAYEITMETNIWAYLWVTRWGELRWEESP